MIEYIKDIINEINRLDDPSRRSLPLPNDNLIAKYELLIGIPFSDEYRLFLKSVSNAFVGYLSPLTLNEEMGGVYGELLSTVKQARDAGVPYDWLPICEDNGNYYCIAPDGRVHFWDHDGVSTEMWPSLSVWAKEVWLGGK